MHELGRGIVIFGVLMVIIGTVITFSDKIPFLGKLPGDILFKKGNFTLYAPISTSIIISLLLTIILNLIFRIKR